MKIVQFLLDYIDPSPSKKRDEQAKQYIIGIIKSLSNEIASFLAMTSKKNPDFHRDFYNTLKDYAFSAIISYGNSTTTSLCNLMLAAYLPVLFTIPLVINFLSID
jgi:DNA-binding LacI/PurR family transcriptional regulator